MQSLLARLYVDEYCRQLFHHQPEYVLDGYRLTEAEKSALLGINEDRLNRHADGLLEKRERHMRPAFPFLFAVNDLTDEREVVRLFRRFCGIHPEAPEGSRDAKIQMFAGFISQSLQHNSRVPDYAADVSRYDFSRYDVGHSERAQSASQATTSSGPDEHSADEHSEEIRLDDVLAISPQVRVTNFDYDVLGIASELRQNRLPANVAQKRTTIVLQNQNKKLRMFTVNGPSAILLNGMDGRKTVQDGVDAVESSFGTTGLAPSIIQLLQRLQGENVLVRSATRVRRSAA